MGSRAGWTKAGELLAVSPASRHSSEQSECLEEAPGDLTTGLSLTPAPTPSLSRAHSREWMIRGGLGVTRPVSRRPAAVLVQPGRGGCRDVQSSKAAGGRRAACGKGPWWAVERGRWVSGGACPSCKYCLMPSVPGVPRQMPGQGAPQDLSYIPSPSAQNTILREDTAQRNEALIQKRGAYLEQRCPCIPGDTSQDPRGRLKPRMVLNYTYVPVIETNL